MQITTFSLAEAEQRNLGNRENWIGTLQTGGGSPTLAKSEKLAVAWVKRIYKNWPAEWAVYPVKHFQTSEVIGWGATAL